MQPAENRDRKGVRFVSNIDFYGSSGFVAVKFGKDCIHSNLPSEGFNNRFLDACS